MLGANRYPCTLARNCTEGAKIDYYILLIRYSIIYLQSRRDVTSWEVSKWGLETDVRQSKKQHIEEHQ